MHSKKRKRKPSRKRPINVVVWLWALLFVNVVAGFAFSPLTAVRKVRVVGLPNDDIARFTTELQRIQDTPMMRLNRTWVVDRLGNNAEIDRAEFLPNIFGRAFVRIFTKKPVARIGATSMCLDVFGSQFKCSRKVEGLPIIDPPPRALSTSLTLCGSWQSGQTAQLCQFLSAQVPNVAWSLAVSARGIISLRADSGTEVVLGSFDRWPKKVEKLKSLLAERPDLLQSVRQLNLMSPEAPVFVRG